MAQQELSPLQKEYAAFFFGMLDEFEVNSPSKLSDEEKSEFFNRIKKDWKKKKKELAKQGIVGVNESFNKTILIQRELKKRSQLKQLIKEMLLQEINLDKKKVAKTFSDLGWYTGSAIIKELKPNIYTFAGVDEDDVNKYLYDKKFGIFPVFKKYYNIDLKNKDISYNKRTDRNQGTFVAISVNLNNYM